MTFNGIGSLSVEEPYESDYFSLEEAAPIVVCIIAQQNLQVWTKELTGSDRVINLGPLVIG